MDLRYLEKNLGHQFKDKSLLHQALTHRSAATKNNERLEFLGDAILGMRIADHLYRQYPDADEGQLSRMRAHLVNRETLAAIAAELTLSDFLVLGPGELRSGGAGRKSTQADAVEAIIAAVYLDAGMVRAEQLIDHLFGARLSHLPAAAKQKDPKTRLQEWLQAQGKPLPVYEVMEISGEQHAQSFTVECELPDVGAKARGEGASRRKAEQQAAEKLLQSLGVEA